MPRSFLFLVAAAGMLAACAPATPPTAPRDAGIAAGGLVEPSGEERVIIPQLSGRLEKVYIAEGDTVKAGQLIAEIENAEYRAALTAATAELARREAEYAKAKAGPRREEIDAATAEHDEALAAEHQAAAEYQRRQQMAAQKLIAVEALQLARTQAESATARRKRAEAQRALLVAGTRAEDLAAAAAAVEAAKGERDRAQAVFDKSQIRAPIDGQVLKRDLGEGETVVALSPLPLARIGDLSRLYVRADVDELDIGRVRSGQKAAITSDAFPGQSFTGEVVRVSRRMGRRNSISGDPAEKQDTKILETLIVLDGTPPLPIGLRVDVRITP